MNNSQLSVMNSQLKKGYKLTEVGVIPEDWKITSILACCEYADYRGKTPPKTEHGIFLVTARNIRKGFIDYHESQEFIPSELYDQIMRRGKPQIGDVLITTEAPLGNVAQVDREDVALAQRIIKYRPNSNQLNSTYLKYYFLSDRFQQILNDHSSGSTAKGIKGQVLHQLSVIIPPLPEQRSIAAVLSDTDALIESLEKAIAKKRNLKQATMQQLLTGKTRLQGFSGEWGKYPFFELASCRKERIDPKIKGIQEFCVELEHIESGTGKLIGNSEANEQASLKGVFYPGDVLFGKLRSYLRKYWLANCKGVCSTEIWVLVADPKFTVSEFLYQIVSTDEFIEIASSAYGTHMPRADWKVVKEYEIKCPPIEEQKAIATVLSDMDAEIAALEQRRDKTRLLKQGMMQELLTGRTRLV